MGTKGGPTKGPGPPPGPLHRGHQGENKADHTEGQLEKKNTDNLEPIINIINGFMDLKKKKDISAEK